MFFDANLLTNNVCASNEKYLEIYPSHGLIFIKIYLFIYKYEYSKYILKSGFQQPLKAVIK